MVVKSVLYNYSKMGLFVSDWYIIKKGKGLPQQAEVDQGVLGRLKVFLTFGATRVVGRQSYAPTAFTPGEIPGTHFERLSPPQDTWFCR